MLMLAFDTCLDKTYTVLRTEDDILSSETIGSDEKNYHSAYLFSSIKSLLKSSGKTAEDIDVIAVNAGPGSFTGIRACLSAAKVMSSQIKCKTVGVSSLEILSKAGGDNHIAALDARRNKVYFYDNKLYGAIDTGSACELVKGRKVITDNRLIGSFRLNAEEVISYENAEFELGEILSEIALERVKNGDYTKDLTPLYIQPPPVI